MADKIIKTITHQEISAATASKLGGKATADDVSKTVETYASTVNELAEQYAPTNVGERILIQTPLVGISIRRDGKEMTVLNEDGSAHKTSGGSNRIDVSVTRTLLEMVNNGITLIESKIKGTDKKEKVA